MSLAMTASKYNGANGRGDMRGYNFGPPAGTTTYGQPPWAPGVAISRMGPGAGDPGFFDFLGKVAKGVTGVVGGLGIPIVSGVARTASRFFRGGGVGPGLPGPSFAPAGAPMLQGQGVPRGRELPGFLEAGRRAFPGGRTGMGEGCTNGTRPNKSGYWLKGGQYVEPGSVCVKRRRMNPLNPRALSKAMRRIESAKRATTVLGRITIRKKC